MLDISHCKTSSKLTISIYQSSIYIAQYITFSAYCPLKPQKEKKIASTFFLKIKLEKNPLTNFFNSTLTLLLLLLNSQAFMCSVLTVTIRTVINDLHTVDVELILKLGCILESFGKL